MDAACAAAFRWLRTPQRMMETSCLVLFVLYLSHLPLPAAGQTSTTTIPCYKDNKPQRCVPEFGNIAYNIPVEATNTCGMNGRTDFCTQTEASKKYCGSCYAPDNLENLPAYPASHLTDLNKEGNLTWWQSETMLERIQYPNQVNLTLHLQKAYDITYVQLHFHSPRPESFAIYKRTTENGSWTPYQYYSLTCQDMYGLQEMTSAPVEFETRALCKSEYSDMTPLSGGIVPFSTLEGRPSKERFDETPALREWVTATDIRITLDKLNTFGDELWAEPIVLKSYFYAVADIAVGARCKCNGHASECPFVGSGWKRVCRCEHHTDGPDCEKCLPFYNDAPWHRATSTNAHECKPCNCNGFSTRCFFDEELYKRTGHGGHCLDCQGNRAGANCEHCRENFHQVDGSYCVDCECNDIGSRSKQCNAEGKCQCKPGVGGDKCDRCEANFYEFGPDGCKPCGCNIAGSVYNQPHCDPITGVCNCKENVEGRQCHECKPGYFNLHEENAYGCTPCFCYGHASICTTAVGYSKVVTESSFARGNETWSAEDFDKKPLLLNYNAVGQAISVSQPDNYGVYFLAPRRFLGDQRASYNQDMEFKLRITETSPVPARDIIIEGASLTISQPIFGQNNPLPASQNQEYRFRLHEHTEHGWQPRLTARDFIAVLSNITAIKIRGTYQPKDTGFLDDFRLHTARRGAAGHVASWIETCTCPTGYVGQFCEGCAHKYRHEPANSGPFARCVPCNCNKHAESCEEDSGRCICQHNTEGENCERCGRGYYGNSLLGTPDDCKPCPCPGGGACIELDNDEIVCLECPKGYSGPRCDLCSDGFYGDPTGSFGEIQPCIPCECNNNVDNNAVGNCDRRTGQCLKCIHHTGGPQCDQCLIGYFGDALAVPKGDCKKCNCYPQGTIKTEEGPLSCDQITGRCHCKPHVHGVSCDACEPGYYDLLSGEGCKACNCDPIGSFNRTCNESGQCYCRPGVIGNQCDKCELNYYGFSLDGCKACLCDDVGSLGQQCNETGQCPCRDNVEGRTCNQCKENKHDRLAGCVDCPACYSLVQDAVNDYRSRLESLTNVLNDISNNPTVIDDADFEEKLKEVQDRVTALDNDARYGVGVGGQDLSGKLEELNNRLQTVNETLASTEKLRQQADLSVELGSGNITKAQETAERARLEIQKVNEFLRTEGIAALSRALNRSDQFGQQNKHISEISQEARYLASVHQEEAAKIQKIAIEAENISVEAYAVLREAITKNRNRSDQLADMKSEFADMERRVAATELLVEDTEKAANQSLEEALEVYQEIDSLRLPETPTARLKEESSLLANQAQQISDDAAELFKNHADAWQELNSLLEESEALLEKGEEQQIRANTLLAEVDLARKIAEDAVKLGQNTINEAQETLNLLSSFEKGVEDSKNLAIQAMDTIPEIQALIDEASNKTQRVQDALLAAESDAQKARDTAEEAQTNYAERASKEAVNIRNEAETTKTKAGKLRDETDALAERVALTETRLVELENQAEKDEKLTFEAKDKVGKAKVSVADASKQVQRAMEDIDSILNELSDTPDIDEEAVSELEKKLHEAEEIVRQSDMDERIQRLKDEKFDQTKLLNQYENEVKKLTEEVENIGKIAESLPNGCFKEKTTLEP